MTSITRTFSALLSMCLALATALVIVVGGSARPAIAVGDEDWLGIVNSYRMMSGLDPVVENTTWSTEANNHSCYMLLNGISHHEVPGNPGYTEGGHTAGMNGNVAVSTAVGATARSHIELWMTGPFHAIGILRHNLTASGFGKCADADTRPWRSAATLDVIRGLNTGIPRPSTPTVFPGRGSTVPVHQFIAETPNPVTMCGWTDGAGLPLLALMPNGVSTASSTLTGPSGPIEVCTLHPGNVTDATARAVLESENAVVIMPKTPLPNGAYTASISSSGGSVQWSFDVDTTASLPSPPSSNPTPQPPTGTNNTPSAPATSPIGQPSVFEPVTPYRHADSRRGHRVVRLRADTVQTVDLATPLTTAVSANFTVAGQSGPGYLSAYNCTSSVPSTSTVNFAWQPAANQAVVPLSEGSLCLVSSADTEVIIDVNGWFGPAGDSTTTFVPVAPSRIYDTRGQSVASLRPGEVRTVPVRGVRGGAPAGATAVALNLTAVAPQSAGYVRAFPCDARGASEVSNVNFDTGQTRPNSAIVPLSADGTVCLESDSHLDLIVDLSGHFVSSGGYRFTALQPTRLVDTRSAGVPLRPNTVRRVPIAGTAGVPGDVRGIALNVTAVSPGAPGYLTVYPCGQPPASSNLNFHPDDMAVANGVMVGVDADGHVCLMSDQHVHVLIDVSGAWK